MTIVNENILYTYNENTVLKNAKSGWVFAL
jgi:hypothetical protein